MSDDDRTLIQSSGPVRPNPGGRAPTSGAPVPPPATPPPPQAPPPSGAYRTPPPPPMMGHQTSTRIDVFDGLNPVVNAASTLLNLMAKLRNTASHANVTGLFNQVSQELKQFEARLKQEGTRPEVVLAARYCLCAVIDEVVLNTPWGANSAWGQKTLLSAFHNETAGGEKFFLILDRMKQSPGENLHVLELLYLLVSFGFEGKYRVMDRGRDHLDGIRDELYHSIRRFRGQPEADLSLDWRHVEGRLSSMVHYIPLWVVGACVGAVMLLTYSGFRFALYNTTTPLYEQFVELEQGDGKNKGSSAKANP